jgi:hypothetical protein
MASASRIYVDSERADTAIGGGDSKPAPGKDMKIAVVICTLGRPVVLHDTVCSIQRQWLKPMHIFISAPSEEHVLPETLAFPGVSLVASPVGVTLQRNRALDTVGPEAQLVAFLDDDMELSESYLYEMSRLFSERPELVVACGTLLHDGGRSSLITRQEANRLCVEEDNKPEIPEPPGYAPLNWTYGCNMIARWATVADVRFDERLPGYAWLEDSDYGVRCTVGKHGPVTCVAAKAVHLGWRGGRTSGLRLGFAQIVNPLYLWRKAKVFPLWHVVVQYWLRCLGGNFVGILTRDTKWDRLGILKGNLLGFKHLLSGRCDPSELVRSK